MRIQKSRVVNQLSLGQRGAPSLPLGNLCCHKENDAEFVLPESKPNYTILGMKYEYLSMRKKSKQFENLKDTDNTIIKSRTGK